MDTLLATPRPLTALPASRPTATALPDVSILPERIPLVAGIWIEPASDPGHAAHLDPVSTLLDQLRKDFPETPVRLLVPPKVAAANWLRQLATKAGCPVSLTAEIAPGVDPVETLVRHSEVILCLAPGQEHSEATAHLVRWQREGRITKDEAGDSNDGKSVHGGPVEFWDLSRGGRARRQQLPATLARAEFSEFARHVRAFNRRTNRMAPSLQEATAREKAALWPEETAARLSAGQTATLDRCALNVAMAHRFRPLARAAQLSWTVLAVLTGSFLTISAQTSGAPHTSLLAVAAASLGLAVLARILHGRWLRLSVYHAALGESMRIHFVRCLAGLPRLIPESIPTRQRAPRWLQVALDVWIAGLAQGEPVSPPAPERLQMLRQHWIQAQTDRYAGKAAQAEHRGRRYRRLAAGSWILAAALAAMVGALAVHGASPLPSLPLSALAALAILAASLCGQRAASAQLEQQRHLREARAFASASLAFRAGPAAAELANAAQLINALTVEVLLENAESTRHELDRGFSPVPDFR